MSRGWTRDQKIALTALIVAGASAVAAIVVPEIRCFLHLKSDSCSSTAVTSPLSTSPGVSTPTTSPSSSTSPIDNSKGTTQKSLSPDESPPSSSTLFPPPNTSPSPDSKSSEGILFQLKGCRNENETIKCEFLVTDQIESRKLTIYGRSKSRIIDPQGNEYLVERVRFGSATANSIVNQNLAQGIGLTAFISFENVPTQVNQLALVEVSAYTKRQGEFTIQFRDIPVLN